MSTEQGNTTGAPALAFRGLAKAYGDWIRYIDQNYATGEPVTE